VPLHLAGAPVRSFYGFGSTIGAAVNGTLMSYCAACHIGVNIDTSAIADPDALMDSLREGFDEVLAIGGGKGHTVLPAHMPQGGGVRQALEPLR
jgi:diacylglycerol O-acyltransferase